MEHGIHITLSTTSHSVSPKLSLALYAARVAQSLVRTDYEPLAIYVMHLVLSSQWSLKCDERHFKCHHYVQPKFAKEVKPSDQQCLGFLNDIYKKQNMSNCSLFQLAVATQSKALPNTNSHAPPYNPQKHANHPQQPYHTMDMSSHVLHVMLVIGDASEHLSVNSP